LKNFPGSEIWSEGFGKKIESNKHNLKNLKNFQSLEIWLKGRGKI
jgi:hypothetical protein